MQSQRNSGTATQSRPPRVLRTTVYTFTAVFLSIFAVAAIAVPLVLNFAQKTYIELVTEINERQARAMSAFLQLRLADGLSEDKAIREFQAATAGSGVDRGYVCLIDQTSSRYLSHPSPEQLGMEVKPGAVFTPLGESSESPWRPFLNRGDTADGELTYGPQMAQEAVYFTGIAGTNWTVSSHENLARVQSELKQLRRALVGGATLLSLLFALPASLASRAVSLRREQQIERQGELERQLLEQENQRRSDELEQAREFQLSLLPKALPMRPEVVLAARMETATEVGGDFYDVIERQDGSLLIAIGDATGHGLKSSMMALAAKSLLAQVSETDDLAGAMSGMALALRKMRLGRLNMAFAMGRLTGRTLEVVGAGMPPALIHRASSGRIEELPLSGVPLGSPMNFPYSSQKAELEVGDTVLWCSDGLPELGAGEQGELGYQGLEELFSRQVLQTESVETLLDEILRQTVFSRTQDPDDDITLLALKAT